MKAFYTHQKRFSRLVVYSLLSLSTAYCSYNDETLNSFVTDVHEAYFQVDSASLNFMVISDWGFNGSENQQSVAMEMDYVSRIAGIQLILTCGDNFQLAGVKSANDYLWYSNFEAVYSDSSVNVPWYPALGNHDYLGNTAAQVEYSTLNDRWNMPANYYTFAEDVNTNTRVRFIVLDTPQLIEEFDAIKDPEQYESIAQYAWLKNVLANTREDWIIVTGHHPVFSASTFHGDTRELNILLKPLLDKYQVDFYICGHDHHFEHAREENTTTDYIVTGTGGEVRPVGMNFRTVFSMTSLGFSYFSISADYAKLCFITNEGRIAYQYIRHK